MSHSKPLKHGGPLAVILLASAHLAYAQAAKPATPPRATRPAASTPAQSATPTVEDNRELNLTAYVELLRSDLRSQKVAIITEVMQFTEAEDEKFWPVYREYESKLAAINDERMAMIKEYARSYETLTDATADRLARTALDLEGRRQQLKVTYYDRFKSAISAKTAARFFQVENQILLLLDLQIAAALPVVTR